MGHMTEQPALAASGTQIAGKHKSHREKGDKGWN